LSPDESLEQGRNARDSSLTLAVRMVADVTETRYVIPSLEFKT